MNAGEEIGGYSLVRALGSGGAGSVWLAEDGGGSGVALKLVHPALAASEAARRRLEREAATVNSVRSDRVAHVVDVETEASQPFIASEYVEGPTLAALLKRGPLDPRAVAVLAEDLRSTIDAVHDARIVHRDIKPSNIICSTSGPVLIDFGIAMTDGDEHFTRTGLVSGTAGYTAPELLRAQEASDATDWWAWCATLLTASTGRPPFGTGDVQGVIMRVLTGEPDLAGLDTRIAEALRLGLCPDPAARPSPERIVGALLDAAGFAGGVALDAVDWPTAYSAQLPFVELPESGPAREDGLPRTRALPNDAATSALAQAPAYPPVRDLFEDGAEPDEDFEEDRDDSEECSPDGLGGTEILEGAALARPDETAQWPGPGAVGWAAPGVGAPWGCSRTDRLPAAPPPEQGCAPAGCTPIEPWAAPGPPGPVPSWTQPLPPSYAPALPRTAWLLGPALLMPLAMLPILLGAPGTAGVLVLLVLVALVGACLRRREFRRARNGGPKASDTPAMLAASPLMLVKSVAALAAGLVMGALVPYAAWGAYSISATGAPAWSAIPELISSPGRTIGVVPLATDPKGSIAVWLVVWSTLVLAWCMPTCVDLRDGTSRFARAVLGPGWVRLVAALLCAGVVAATWFVLTGGPA